MATVETRSGTLHTVGDLPAVGDTAPDFTLTGTDMEEVTRADFAGKRIVLNIFPSLDTRVCAASVRKFNELAAGLDNTVVVSVSKDLPYAHDRFCVNEGINDVVSTSAFRSTFGEDYGVEYTDGALRGLLSRAVVVIDTDGKVLHTQQTPSQGEEPDYEAAIAVLG